MFQGVSVQPARLTSLIQDEGRQWIGASGFMIFSLLVLIEQFIVIRCLEGVKLGSPLVKSSKADTRIYVV
jgi:hypothetical protein